MAAANFLMDPRVQWIQAKTSSLYQAYTADKWKYLMSRSDGKFANDLKWFLDEAPVGCTAYFYITDSQGGSGSKDARGSLEPSGSKTSVVESVGSKSMVEAMGSKGVGDGRGSVPMSKEIADSRQQTKDLGSSPSKDISGDPTQSGVTKRVSMKNIGSASVMMRRMSALARTRLQPQMGLNILPNNQGNIDNNATIVYFVKLTPKVDITGQVVNDGMTRALIYGMTESQFLIDLKLMLREIYMPALTREGGRKAEAEEGEEEEHHIQEEIQEVHKCFEFLPQHIYDEIQSSTVKFLTQVNQAAMQVYGNVNIRIPDVANQWSVATIEQIDRESLHILEVAVEEWTQIIEDVVRRETNRARSNKYPMAEIDLWRERSSSVSTLYEQLQLPAVQNVLKMLLRHPQQSTATIAANFEDHFQELQKMHTEAKDNVKFLTTLERHFKNLSIGPVTGIVDVLPSLLNSIRMVWIISRYYNCDEYMEPLMQRVAAQISDKVEEAIQIPVIFSMEVQKAMQLILDGKNALDKWEWTYLYTREKIEESGTDHRWEFDRLKLFKKTKYMSRICHDLYEITQVLDQFYKFLGPELKEVTGDSADIDDLLREVAGLVSDFKQIPGRKIFDDKFQPSWDSMITRFRERVEIIEHRAIEFLDTSFQNLRSAEGAFQLLQNFKNIESRERINSKMSEKFADILKQYGSEVHRMSALFRTNKDAYRPPKNTPPIAGAIQWARSVFYRVKKPVQSFKTMPHLLQTAEGQVACKDYVELGKEILAYEQRLYKQWSATAVEVATQSLKCNILSKIKVPAPSGGEYHTYTVNFSNELDLLIREAKLLDQLGGFELPQLVLNVALQEDKYKQFLEQLLLLVDSYDKVVGDLSPVQRNLLSRQIKELDKCLQPGLVVLNWNSLGILDFIEEGSRGVAALRSVRDQVEKSQERIENVVEAIESAELVKPFDWERIEVMDHLELYEFFEKYRESQVAELVKKYESISPFLIKIEETTAGTKTGSAPSLKDYYAYWEKRIFNCITTMLIKAMATFQTLFSNPASGNMLAELATKGDDNANIFGGGEGASGGETSFSAASLLPSMLPPSATQTTYRYPAGVVPATKRPPLLKIKAQFNPPDVVLGTLHQVFKTITKLLQNVLHSANFFVRWLEGTCRIVPPQPHQEEDSKQVDFTFYRDIYQNPALIEMTVNIQNNIQNVFQVMNKFLRSWKKYDTQWKLWDNKGKQELEKLYDKRPTVVFFDVYINVYKGLAEGLSTYPREKDIGFVRIDSTAVIAGIRAQTLEWVQSYGDILRRLANKELEKVTAEIDLFTTQLSCDTPDTLEKLKFVLGVISQIMSTSMDQEARILHEVQERYRTLQIHEYKPLDEKEEIEAAENLPMKWGALKDLALTRDRRMLAVKQKFAEVTTSQVEEFQVNITDVYKEFKSSGPATAGLQTGPDGGELTLEEGLEMLKRYDIDVKQYQKRREELVKAQTLFQLPVVPCPELASIDRELKVLKQVYDLYSAHAAMVGEFSQVFWQKLDIEQLQKASEDFDKKVRRMPKEQKEIGDIPAFHKLEKLVLDFKNSVPLIQSLKHPAIKVQHWKELQDLAKKTEGDGEEKAEDTSKKVVELDPTKMTLHQVFSLELHRFPDDVNEIVVTAQNELKIENELAKIDSLWRNYNFLMYPHKGEINLLQPNEDMRLILDDHILTLQSMASSKYAAKLLDTIKKWEKNLNIVSEVLEVWLLCQRKWMYLESIFLESDDIRLQLPEEAKKFDKVHKVFIQIMQATYQNKNVLHACCANEGARVGEFKDLIANFDKIQKSLTDYLDTKRSAFPRFYLISDDELLSVLGTSDVNAIQPHMIKLFDNCKELHLPRTRVAQGMYSEEKEYLLFHETVKIEGAVEDWLNAVDAEMQDTLLRLSKTATYTYAKEGFDDRCKWLQQYNGMVAILGTQIWWTWVVEDAFRAVAEGDKNGMKKELSAQNQQVTDLIYLVRSDISKLQRKKVNSLIILDVHARDVVDRFVRDSVLEKEAFAWESQLRFYWDRRLDDVQIKQCTGTLSYCYEYQGLNGRLVITPLTDRCVMTLTTALYFKMGGAPAGPAGTGKTETVKDLAKSLAISCIVTNCGDGLDYRAMGAIFSGLSETGFWGCFDEFNRINPEVLSVVAAQIKTIQLGLTLGKKKIELLGRDVTLKVTIGYFVTMNPGYAGRSELPDNLKAMFRPVTMIVPDLLMICDNMLMSEGFIMSKVLSKKMTVLYALSAGQLSKQYHYDFKLRALKSVLVMAGDLKRGSPDLNEDVVLMRALRDMNIPKFVKQDVPLFQGLLGDLFPGLDCPRVGHPELKAAIVESLVANKMKPSQTKYDEAFELQVDKIMQLYETMLTRHSTMVVGRTGGGKSVVINTLANAQKLAFNLPTKIFPINPKACTTDELYGVLNPATRDWTDGLLSKIFRDMNLPIDPKKPERRYILYDGDVDALWIENMNSVMDDNKLLTLPNGERIRLESHCAMLFEVFDLQYASPATVSRCGMVYVDDRNLGPGPYYDTWVRNKCGNHENMKEMLFDLYDKFYPALVQFIYEGRVGDRVGTPLTMQIPRSQVGTDAVYQLTRLFDSMIQTCEDDGPKGGDDAAPMKDVCTTTTGQEISLDSLEHIYVYCLTWSIGAAVDEDGRKKYDEFIRKKATKMMPQSPLYDNFFEYEGSGRWVSWEELIEEWSPPEGIDFNKILIPTVDTTRYSWLIKKFLQVGQPTLVVGESGTAKSVTTQTCLETGWSTDESIILNISFSSRTSSMDFQRTIEDNVSKRTGRQYGPEQGKKLRVFIDDLSMPKIDKYGTQQPLALLKFLVERGYFYHRLELERMIIQDCEYVSCMQPPGSGRNHIDPRVVSLYACIGVLAPTSATVERIYASILGFRFQGFFSDSAKEATLKLPSCTMELHRAIIASLPPTPAKFHYIFSMRDLSRVFQNMYQASDPQYLTGGAEVVRMWRNECLRVYCDRLNEENDKNFVGTQMTNIVGAAYSAHNAEVMKDPLVFGDFQEALDIMMKSDTPYAVERSYVDLGDFPFIKKILDAVLENYNLDRSQMNLVLFIDALSHLTRIHRIIRLTRGHALLIGIGGSGKQSLTRLATYTACYTLYEIMLARGYGDSNIRDDLKALYTATIKMPHSFLFTDAHVVQEGFLEYINNILTVGMVPALMADDEKEPLYQVARPVAKQMGIPETSLWGLVVNMLKDNLHMVLAMSPAGSNLRTRCRNFPGMVACCTIDWFFSWPEEALLAVAEFFMTNVDLPADNRAAINQTISYVHTSVTTNYSPTFEAIFKRKNFATPKNYLDFLHNYADFLEVYRHQSDALKARLGGGLQKLIQAAEQVAVMSKELEEKLVVVAENAASVAALIDEINTKTEAATVRQEEANQAAKQIEEDNVIIVREKADADEALSAALPALDAAAAALDSLDKKDITEIKSMAQPPMAVMTVCMCVVILRPLGREDQSQGWIGAKAMLSDTGFMKSLIEYKKDDMKERQIRQINDLLNRGGDDFVGDRMKSISKAGYGLLQWVLAMTKYYSVAKTVEPKRKLVKELQAKKEAAEENLANIQDELVELAKSLEALQKDEKEQSAKLKELKDDADTMQRRLGAASQLISGLGSEKVRWTADLEVQDEIRVKLVGDCLLGAGFVSYAGPFNHEYRTEMVYTDWHSIVANNKIPCTEKFKVQELLTTEVEIASWSGFGLPTDELSIQNGILVTRSARYPLCVDPQMQAVSWIKKKEAKAGLTVKTFNDDYIKFLELAITYGKPFLFENLDEELDPMIDPVLEKKYVIVSGQKMIKLGDSELEVSPQFTLSLCTKLSNPSYTPEVMGKVSIVNCVITLDGLAAQLLNVVVSFERPDLEQQRLQLVQTMSDNRQILKGLEDTLLRELAASKGSILDNEELINTLNTAKTKSIEIGESLAEAAVTAVEIEKTRSTYQKVAKRGSILYFTMSGLVAISNMYEYSLGSYLEVFENAIREAKQDRIPDNRLKNLREKITQMMYDYTCMGIFEKHKLLFSFKMTTMIMNGDAELIQKEFDFYMKGNPSLEKAKKATPYSWISDSGWKDLELLTTLDPVLKTLCDDICKDEQAWKTWYDTEAPESEPIPGGFSEVDPFKQMLIVRCFRPDRILTATKNFIIWRLYDYFVQPPSLAFDKIYSLSSERSPIVFVLSPGADPLSDLQKLGEVMGYVGTKFKFVSLGQGMGPVAASNIDTGSQRGHWVILQNCHLLVSWLRTLEKILEGITKPHKDYRLWLTTMPIDEFPMGILQKSLKVVTEPPDGLKLNMKQTYTKMSDADLNLCPHWAFKPMLYVTAFFHAIVQDRRKFGRIGWNVAYDFNESDLRISNKLSALYLNKCYERGEVIPWETLRYLIGEAMYGGRVTDDYDRRVLNTYLEDYMGDFLFDENVPFFFSRDGYEYDCPKDGNHAHYMQIIVGLPIQQNPGVFGLHPNAEINYFTNSAREIWVGLLSMETGSGGGDGGFSKEDYVSKIADDVLKRIPDAELKFLKDDVPTPNEVVLLQEIERMEALTTRIYNTLQDLKRAIKGEIGMSQELDELGQSLFNGFLPSAWSVLAPQTEKPLGSWMDHYEKRYNQYDKWTKEGDPIVFWLSGLHIPESLLSSLVQTTCRRRGWALDKSTLYTEVTKFVNASQATERMLDGTYAEGMYLEGARWDLEKGCLARQNPKELVVMMPLIQIIPVEANRLKLRNSLPTPVYITQLRRNAMGVGLVFQANLHTEIHPSLWVLQSCALMLNDDS